MGGSDAGLEAPVSEHTKDEGNSSQETTYILNTNTGKFHKPGCKSVKQISDKNKQESSKSREELMAAGYEPCKNCNP